MGVSFVKSTMSPSPNTIEVYKAQSKTIQLMLTEQSEDVDGNPTTVPMDLTGCTLLFNMKHNGRDPRALLTKSSLISGQITILSPATSGLATLQFIPSDTQYLEAKEYQYDIWIVTPSTLQFPVVEISQFIIKQPITLFT